MLENEGAPESVTETSGGEQLDLPLPASDPAPTSTTATQATKIAEQRVEPESLRAKMEKKMAAAKARDEANGIKAKVDPATPTPVETPVKDPKTGQFQGKTPVIPGVVPGVEAPKYVPNFKFKFTDSTQKQQEKDFPEWAKAAIKDEASEKEIRSVFEKAGGLDFVLPRFQEAQGKLKEVMPRLSAYDSNVAEMKEMYSRGNMQGIFDKLGITEEKVLQYAVERAKYYQLPPEQQSIIKAQQDAEKNAQIAEQNAMGTQERYEEQARQIKQLQLNTVLQRPDVSQAEKSFDEKMGKKGAFFEQVRLLGETTWYRTGGKIDLTPEQAIMQVMENYGLTGAQAATPPVAPTAPAATPAAAVAPPAPAQTVKVIPNVGSRASSPAAGKTSVRSIDDLKNRLKEMTG